MNNNPLNKTTRMALLFSGVIDALLGSILLLIGFHWLPVNLAEFGFEDWHAILVGGILFFIGAVVVAYNFSRLEE
jgi:hypothetical protein